MNLQTGQRGCVPCFAKITHNPLFFGLLDDLLNTSNNTGHAKRAILRFLSQPLVPEQPPLWRIQPLELKALEGSRPLPSSSLETLAPDFASPTPTKRLLRRL